MPSLEWDNDCLEHYKEEEKAKSRLQEEQENDVFHENEVQR